MIRVAARTAITLIALFVSNNLASTVAVAFDGGNPLPDCTRVACLPPGHAVR
jgi:hypothetical protein